LPAHPRNVNRESIDSLDPDRIAGRAEPPSIRGMRLSTRHLRLWSLIVLVTMLYGTLVPGLARAFSQSPDAWLEICTPSGTKLVAADAVGDPAGNDEARATRDACPFCLSGSHAAVVPTTLRIAFGSPPAAARLPQSAAAVSSAPPPRTPAQPRAPPALG